MYLLLSCHVMYLLLLIFDVFVADAGAFPSNKISWCHLTSDVLMLLLANEGMYVQNFKTQEFLRS